MDKENLKNKKDVNIELKLSLSFAAMFNYESNSGTCIGYRSSNNSRAQIEILLSHRFLSQQINQVTFVLGCGYINNKSIFDPNKHHNNLTLQ